MGRSVVGCGGSGLLAQLAEHRAFNPGVEGSIPSGPIWRRFAEMRRMVRDERAGDEICSRRHQIWLYGPVAQLAEATDLRSVQCGFESPRGYYPSDARSEGFFIYILKVLNSELVVVKI